ncbi:MAG: AhpC/TSA family protein [Opitutae bacterium]|nr:AhpC/TSA family protein [Opitutae bacterium]
MKYLKSIFISSYMMLLMALASYAAWNLRSGNTSLAWSGVLLTSAPLLMVIGRLVLLRNVARTSAHFPLLHLLCAVGAALAAWAWRTGGAGSLPLFLAGVAWAGFALYVYWYSHFSRSANPRIAIGSMLPAFTLKDTNGNSIRSSQLTERPAIILFYRGNWCPLCMAQIKELAERHEEFTNMGVRIVLISPQPPAKTTALARKYGVAGDFLIDADNSAARTLGIADPAGLPMGMQMLGYANETVLPTILICNQQGKVVWTHATDNYRLRPEPDVYLEVLRRHSLVPQVA